MSIFKSKKNQNNDKRYLIIITGCAGSGKTTIGKALSKRLNYAYIDKDTVTREYTDFILTQFGSGAGDRESDFYRKQILPIEYRITFKLCKEILENGSDVVLTIPFIDQIKNWSEWMAIKDEAMIGDNINIKFIWIKHDIDTEKSNILKRNAVRDTYKLNHWDQYAATVDGIQPSPEFQAYIYVNDCEVNLSDTLAEVTDWIKK